MYSRQEEVVPLSLAFVIPCWSPVTRRHKELRKAQMCQEVRGADHVSYKKLLRELVPLSLEKRECRCSGIYLESRQKEEKYQRRI